MSLICKRFETEEAPYTAETLSDEHKIPIRLTKKILYELQDMHMIYEPAMDGDDESIGYLPSVDINRMNGYAAEQTGHSRNRSLQNRPGTI